MVYDFEERRELCRPFPTNGKAVTRWKVVTRNPRCSYQLSVLGVGVVSVIPSKQQEPDHY